MLMAQCEPACRARVEGALRRQGLQEALTNVDKWIDEAKTQAGPRSCNSRYGGRCDGSMPGGTHTDAHSIAHRYAGTNRHCHAGTYANTHAAANADAHAGTDGDGACGYCTSAAGARA